MTDPIQQEINEAFLGPNPVESIDNSNNLLNHLKKLNNSQIVYPMVVIIFTSIISIIFMIQKNVSFLTKFVVILMYILILLYTAITFRKN